MKKETHYMLPVHGGDCRLSNASGSLTCEDGCRMPKEAFTCTRGAISAALVLVSYISARPHQHRHYLYTDIYEKPCSSANSEDPSAESLLY
jgi:hypothetical protein